ncbi:MAG: response regulator [Thermoanaerobaculia bacterium]
MTASKTIGRRMIAVVEDDASMRHAVERLLLAAGREPVAYESAEALLSAGESASVACVVSDLRLPAMSGLELLAEMRGRGWTAPLILVTAYDTAGRREEALRRGAVAYLVKPFAGTDLLDAIRTAVEPLEAP